MPYFGPERFRTARSKDPIKSKPLPIGLKELGEQGAFQVLETSTGGMLLVAVGQLQFEIVAQRLQTEYNVDAIYAPADIHTARWLTFPNDALRRQFEKDQQLRMGVDVDGNPVYLATNRYNLELLMEKWSEVRFHATREHGQRFD